MEMFKKLCPLHLIYQSDPEYRMQRIPQVHLQDEQTPADNYKCRCEGKDELDFDSEKELTDDPATSSLPLWTSRTAPRDFVCGSPPFLSYSNQCRYLPSQKGSEATADGEQVLMEMMDCESPYEELSFKYFIREEQNTEEPGQEEVGQEDSRSYKREVKPEENNRNSKRKTISRDFSIDSERFLLKVFLPVIVGSKMSKLISTTTPSREESSDIDLTSTDGTHQKMNNTNSRSSSRIGKTRWSCCSGTCKPPRQRGCLFL